MQYLRLLLCLNIVLWFHSPAALGADSPAQPSLRNLEKAKETYGRKAEAIKADLLKDLDAREVIVRNKGDKAAVDVIKAERAAFTEKGQLPKVIAVSGYVSRMKAATAELEAAYTLAIRELIRNRMDDEATALQKELGALSRSDGFASWIDLLKLADLTKQNYAIRWIKENDGLTVDRGADWSILLLRYAPPEEYELEAVVDRIPAAGAECFEIGTVVGSHRFYMTFDDHGTTAFTHIDGKVPDETIGHSRIGTTPVKIQIIVRKAGVSVMSDGKEICKYTGSADRLSDPKSGVQPGALFVGAAPNSGFHVKTLRLKEISGTGKVLPGDSKPDSR